MPRTEKYFVGPKLLGDIRDTITRVAGFPDKTSGPHIEAVHQELPRPGGSRIKMCTFTGSWNKDASKTVTLRGVTTTPNTLTVVNIFANITGSTVTSTNFNCAAAKDGTAWYLIAAECS